MSILNPSNKTERIAAILKTEEGKSAWTQSKLRKCSADEVKQIWEELNSVDLDTEETVEPDAFAKLPAPAEKPKTKEPETNPEEPKNETEAKTEEFMPFCMVPDSFDPSASSECVVICKPDNPEAFAACEKHFKAKPEKKTVKRKSTGGGGGKTIWGHKANSQAGKIDECLMTIKAPMSVYDIAEFANARPARTLHHIKHLESDIMNVDSGEHILYTEDMKIYWNKSEKMEYSDDKDTNIITFDLKRAPKRAEVK